MSKDTRHGFFDSVSTERITLVSLTYEGLLQILSDMMIHPGNPQHVEYVKEFFAPGNQLRFVKEQHRSSREANGGFLRLKLEVPDLMDPYWGKHARFDLDLLPALHAFQQLSGVMRFNELRYQAEGNLVVADVCLEVFHFIGHTFATPQDMEVHGRERAIEKLKTDFWQVITPEQFIPVGNGELYRRNPNCGRYSVPRFRKCAGNDRIRELLGAKIEEHVPAS